MIILGLDLSISSTGYSVIEYDESSYSIIECGTIQTNSNEFKTEDERMNYICNELEKLAIKYEINEIVCEEQYGGVNPKVTMMLNKLKGAVMRTYYLNSLTMSYIAPTTWRKHLGQGTKLKGKEDTIQFCREKYGVDFGEYVKSGKNKNEDMYDAVCITLGYLLKNNKLWFKISE